MEFILLKGIKSMFCEVFYVLQSLYKPHVPFYLSCEKWINIKKSKHTSLLKGCSLSWVMGKG